MNNKSRKIESVILKHPSLRNINRFPLKVDSKFINIHNSSSVIKRSKLITSGLDILAQIKKDLNRKTINICLKKTDQALLLISQMLYCEGRLRHEALSLLISIADYMPTSENLLPTYTYLFTIGIYFMVTNLPFQEQIKKEHVLCIDFAKLFSKHLCFHHLLKHKPNFLFQQISTYYPYLDELQNCLADLPNFHSDIQYIKDSISYILNHSQRFYTYDLIKTSSVIFTKHLQKATYSAADISSLVDMCPLLPSHNWISNIIGFDILANVAKSDVNVLVAFQFLAIGTNVSPSINSRNDQKNLTNKLPTIPEFNEKVYKYSNDSFLSSISNTDLLLTSRLDSIQIQIRPASKAFYGGIDKWDCLLVFHYIRLLASIILQTSDDLIRKLALQGRHIVSSDIFYCKNDFKGSLLELASINSHEESWKIRYASIVQLQTICKMVSDVVVQNICTVHLQRIQIYEKDPRVLEAFVFFKLFPDYALRIDNVSRKKLQNICKIILEA